MASMFSARRYLTKWMDSHMSPTKMRSPMVWIRTTPEGNVLFSVFFNNFFLPTASRTLGQTQTHTRHETDSIDGSHAHIHSHTLTPTHYIPTLSPYLPTLDRDEWLQR